jgi:hypothetical protein
MNTDPELFSGRVFRVASAVTRAPGWYRDAFVLGLHSPEYDRSIALKLIDGVASSWVIAEVEFENQPKREPALLYSRMIRTSVSTAEFASNYFEGTPTLPATVLDLYPDQGPMPWGGKGSTPEARSNFLRVLGKSIGPEDDVWRDPELSFEHYGARALLEIPGGFEESLWFLSAGYEVDPLPILRSALERRAAQSGGAVAAIDGPRAIDGPPWPKTSMIIATAFRDVGGGDQVFEERFVTLDAWK